MLVENFAKLNIDIAEYFQCKFHLNQTKKAFFFLSERCCQKNSIIFSTSATSKSVLCWKGAKFAHVKPVPLSPARLSLHQCVTWGEARGGGQTACVGSAL